MDTPAEPDLREQLRRLFEEAPVAYHEIDTHGIIRRVNRAECTLLGYEAEEMLGRPVWEFVEEEQRERSRTAVERKLKGETPLCPLRRVYRSKDGGERILEIHENLIRDAAGRPAGIRSALLDVTERVRAEEALRASEEGYRALVESQAEGLIETDDQENVLSANPAAERIFGTPPGTLATRNLREFVLPEHFALIRFQTAIRQSGETSSYTVAIRRPDGVQRWIHVTASPRCRPDGSFAGSFGALADVTERKAAEDRINYQAQLLTQVNDAIIATGLEGAVTSWNRAAERLFGWNAEEALGRDRREVVRLAPAGVAESHIKEQLHAQGSFSGEVLVIDRSGRQIWADTNVSWLWDCDGRAIGTVEVFHDITARKNAEAELARARDLAEAAARAKSEFLATMSHEIRTPMNGILGMTSLLLDTALTEEQQQYAEAARSSASALLGIINDILDFSKIEAGRLELAPAPFNLEVLLSEVVRLLSPQAREKGLTLTLRYVPGTPRRFVADALRLRQIVMNLAANAVKFTEKGHVFIDVNSTRQAEARAAIRIAVKDTGIGIAADKLPMLFQRFVQVDSSTTRKFGGTGLGLAISKQLVELMGGELEVTSQPGAGSTFSLRLSLEIDRSAPAGPGAALAPAGLQFALMRGRQMRSDSAALVRVLVAEDNKVNQKVATRLLEKIGCRVDLAENGRLAVEMARDLCYDLIFMDCQMPVMDGFQATELIRSEEGASRRTPIVAMTAFVQEEDRRRCLGSGMDGYIAKPVQPEILAEAVAHWCRPAGVPETAR